MQGDDVSDRLAAGAAWVGVGVPQIVGVLALGGVGLTAAALVWWPSWAPAPVSPATLVTATPTGTPTPTATPSVVVVHVTGAVAAPGLVEVAGGSRVADAVAAAGGATAGADTSVINLARPVVDGEQLRVPLEGEEPATIVDAEGGGSAFLPDGRLDLNRATATDLETLPGVGPVLASRIVAHRDTEGPFTEPGGLRDVSGIGERTFQAMADLVVVP